MIDLVNILQTPVHVLVLLGNVWNQWPRNILYFFLWWTNPQLFPSSPQHTPSENEEGDFIAFEVRFFVQMLVDLDTSLLESRMQAIHQIGASTITVLAVAL